MNTILESNFQKDKIGLGRRKQAVARVFLVPGEGDLIINKVSGEKYLQYNTIYLDKIWDPLKKLNLENQFNIIVIASGGGLTGQTDAIQLGVARAICQIDPQHRQI